MTRLVIQLVGGFIGAQLGVGFGVGAFIGGIIGNLLFPTKLPTIIGPRLNDLTVNSSAYGRIIPINYATPLVGGNIIWSTGIEEVRTETTQGGGGSGGGPTQTTVTFTYFADFAISFGRGQSLGSFGKEIDAFGKMWADTKLIFDPIDGPTNVLFAEQSTFHLGGFTEQPDPLIEADKGVGNVSPHRTLAYIVFSNFALKDFGNRIPHIRAEIINSSTAPVTFSTIVHDDPTIEGTVKMFYSWDKQRMYALWGNDALLSRVRHHTMATYDPFTLDRISGAVVLTDPANLGGFDWDVNQIAYIDDRFAGSMEPAPNGDIYFGVNGERTSDGGKVFGMMKIDGSTFAQKAFTVPAGVFVAPNPEPTDESPRRPFNEGLFVGYRTDSSGVPSIEALYTIPNMGLDGISIGLHPWAMAIYPGSGDDVSVSTPIFVIPDSNYDDGSGDMPNFRRNNVAPSRIAPSWIAVDGRGQLWTAFLDQVAIPTQRVHLLFNRFGLIKRQNITTMFDNVTPAAQMNIFGPGGPVYVKSIDRMIFWQKITFAPNKGVWIFHVNPETLVVTDEYHVPGTSTNDIANALLGPVGWQNAQLFGTVPPAARALYNTDPTQDIIFHLNTTRLFRYNPESRSAALPSPIITVMPIDGANDRQDHFYNWQRNAYATAKSGFGSPPGAKIDWEFYNLDRVTQGITDIKAIVDDIIDRADEDIIRTTDALDDLTTGDINAPGRHDVLGFSIQNRESARQTLETLAIPFMFHLIERGNALVAIDRIGDAPVGEVVPEGDLGSYEAGTTPTPNITETRRQEIELPERVDVSYISRPRDYEDGSQHSQRIAELVSTQEKIDLRLPIVLSDNQAKQIASSALFNAWISREFYDFTLPPKWIRLEPGDFLQLPVGGVLKRIIVTNVELGDSGLLKVRAERDDSEVFDTDSVGTTAPVIPNRDLLTPPLPTTQVLMDLPFLRNIDASFGIGFYYAVGGPKGWQGATVLRSTADDFFIYDTVTSDRNSILGFATTVLADGPTTIFDNGNSVTINLLDSSALLQSVTENAVLSTDLNAALLGKELIQFQTVVNNGDGTFTISKLVRGGRGTEQHTGTHVSGERFVLLDADKMNRFSEDSADVGVEHLYKEITFNQLFDDVTPTAFTNTGISEKPYSPVHIRGVRVINNDLTIDWIRRARTTGEWLDAIEVPLDETTEDYEVDILDAPGGTVVRTITTTASGNGSVVTPSTQSAFYDEADQVADPGIIPGTPVDVEIFQLSAIRGRGFPGVGLT